MDARQKTLSDPTHTLFPISSLNYIIPIIPDLSIDGANLIQSPITFHLSRKFPQKTIQDIAMLYFLHKHTWVNRTPSIEYGSIMNYIAILIEMLYFVIERYNQPDMDFIRDYPRVSYIQAVSALLRTRLDIQLKRMHMLYAKRKAIDKKTKALTLPAASEKLIKVFNKKIIETYEETEKTVGHFNALLNTYEEIIGDQISPYFKFTFYQSNLEKIIFKKIVFNIKTQTELKTLGAAMYLEKLASYLPHIPEVSYHLHYLLLKVKVAFSIDREKKQAIEHLIALKDQLIAYSLTPITLEEKTEVVKLFNLIGLMQLSLYIEKINKSDKKNKRALINECIDGLLFSKGTIYAADDENKIEYTNTLESVINRALTTISSELKFSTLDTIDELIAFAEQLNALPPLFIAPAINRAIAEDFSSNYQKLIGTHIQKAHQTKSLLEKEAIKNAEKFDALKKQKEDYEKNFENILSELTEKIKATSKQAKIKQKPMKPSSMAAPIETPLVVGVSKAGDDLAKIEEDLEAMHCPDEAEKMLYEGDACLQRGEIDAALAAYQEALNQTNLQTTPNTEVIAAIEMQLSHTKNLIQLDIKRMENAHARLKEQRKNFIIELGLRVMIKEGVPEKERNLKNKDSWDAVFNRGYAIFKTLREKRASQGKGNSNSKKTLQRQQLEANLKQLHTWHNAIGQLVNKISTHNSIDNFPELSNNPSVLFPAKPKAKATAPKTNLQKRRKRK